MTAYFFIECLKLREDTREEYYFVNEDFCIYTQARIKMYFARSICLQFTPVQNSHTQFSINYLNTYPSKEKVSSLKNKCEAFCRHDIKVKIEYFLRRNGEL